MLVAKKKAVGHVLSIFKGQSSSTMKYSQVQLGSVEGNDLLGVSLHKEATTGSRRSLKKVLHSAKCVDFPNNLGQTPLFCACARNNEGTALLLLEYGANPNEKSQNGMTPTHAACFMGNVCLLRKLIEAGGDLRLHDTDGAGMREWALRNTEPKRRGRMLEFLNKTHLFAMTYSGDTASRDQLIRFGRRQHMKTSLLELMKQRSSHDSGVKSLQRVKSMGFGKVYLGSDHDGGLMSIIPLVSEALLFVTNSNCFDCGYNTFIEEMEWMNTPVSVKQVKPDALTEDGIDLLISDAEQLGKLRHPNILLLMGICQPSCLDNIMVLLERINYATLYHLLHETKRKLLTSQKMNLVHQMCGAMEFIHSQNLIHCGLSSMAVYLVSIGLAKIGNLEFMVEGLKAELGKLSAVSQVSHRGFLYNWMSPELMQARPPCYSSDVYSFCSVLWEMFAEQVPWSGAEAEEILHSVVEEKTSLDLNVAKVPEKLKAILGYGLEIKEDLRLNKFSFIANWLKADSTLDPQFQKGPLKSSKQNHSGNRTGSESSSTTSSQSAIRDTVREMGWGRSDLQFMDRCDPAKLSDTDIDKVSLQGFSKEDLPTPLSRTNTCGTYCADPGNLLYMHGWSCEQEQQVGDDRPLYRSSPALMNTAVVGPGTLSHPGKSLVRPASHMDPAMHGYPGTGWGPSLGFGRNNNGKPSAHEQTRSVTLPRSFLSQPQLW
ncbi:inactive serine/threonine-protein kinase TEX14 [Aplysia californica]|uniref:Inactive serine/threonine-protein kinase TEX14 n=1 Tax=Aplysia californica TaxID=6500 RepID=A0ABM0JG35_APLCA|nr:inactive serine/threonine-protein kinase TEX14 [Aplysia californica]